MFTSKSDFDRADWQLLRDGAVTLFWKPEILADARNDLIGLDYEVSEVSCGASFEGQMSRALKWEEHFGYAPWTGSLDAFNDGMRYYPFGPSGRSAFLTGFHQLVAADRERAHTILDILEKAARDHLLEAKLLIALVQTDDPLYSCSAIGARHANGTPASG